MNYIAQFKNQSIQEVRDFIKENLDNPQVIDGLIAQKEEIVIFLLQNKIFNDLLFKKLVETPQDLEYFIDQCIDQNFTPPYNYVEEVFDLSAKGDQYLTALVKTFPSLPITVQLLMKSINKECESSSISILQVKPEFQRPEIFILMFKTGFKSIELINMACSNQVVANKVIDDINQEGHKVEYPAELIRYIIKNFEIKNLDPEKALKLDNLLDSQCYEILFNSVRVWRNKKNTGHYSYYHRNHKETLDWNEELEKLETSTTADFIVMHAPEGSKFRKKFVIYEPIYGTDEELLDLSVSNPSEKIFLNLMTRSFSVVKKVNLEKMQDFVSPGELADTVRGYDGNHDKALYLYESLSSKYKPALYKILPLDKIPQTESTRKKSYFFEAFQGLKRNSLESFREALSHGYSLEQFVKDSHQSSKAKGCENLSLNTEIVISLTKEELLGLIETPIRMYLGSRYHDDEESNKTSIPYKLTVSEAFMAMKKFDVANCFDIVDNQEQFLLSSELNPEGLSDVFERRKEIIFNNPTLLTAYLKRAKSVESLNMSSDMVSKLSQVLDSQELRKIASVDSYELSSCLNIKCTDNEYFVTQEQIDKHLQSKYHIEDTDFIKELSIRDPEYVLGLTEAYLKGNKGLTEFLKEKVNIRRSKIEFFEKLKVELTQSPQEIVEQIFNSGARLSEFKNQLLDYKTALKNYGNNREVLVDSCSYDQLENYGDIPGVKIVINEVNISCSRYYWALQVEKIPSNVVIKQATLGELNSDSLKNIKDILQSLKNIPLRLENNLEPIDKLSLALAGVELVSLTEAAQEVLRLENLVSQLDMEKIKILEPFGLLIDDKFIEEVLEHHLSDEAIMEWLSNRVGSLESFTVGEGRFSYIETSKYEKIKTYGLNIVPDEELELLEIKQKALQEGENFSPINVSEFSLKTKTDLIKFIENEVDKNYSKLNLISLNLDTIEVLTSYSSMKTSYSLDDSDLINLMNIPQNMQSKKFLKGFRDLVSLAGGGFTYKVDTLKRAVKVINPHVELEISDLVNYDNLNDVKSSDTLNSITLGVLLEIEKHAQAIKNNQIFLKGQKKAGILRFIRTCSEHGDNYMRDILEMINSVVNGYKAIEDRINTLKQEPGDHEETIKGLQNSIDGLKKRLEEVSEMDEAKHMHDRLVPLLSFIKSDPVQPLGQDKYRKFEESKELESSLGYKLFFPKTRGDLQYLGDENGWCVNYHRSYGDNVINKGNILVGICEKGQPSTRENVIALAHYLNRGNGNYQLEQLKWSKRKKNGTSNVDATNSFNHSLILSEIKTYLKEYNSKRG
jgi:hypothetical protein